MSRFLRPLILVAFAASLAGCASQPAPTAQAELTPPPKKQLDAKTQLETGRKY
jgi:hypothetical protein